MPGVSCDSSTFGGGAFLGGMNSKSLGSQVEDAIGGGSLDACRQEKMGDWIGSVVVVDGRTGEKSGESLWEKMMMTGLAKERGERRVATHY